MLSLAVHILLVVLSLDASHSQKCIASVFGNPGDRNMGTVTACHERKFDPTVMGIAHRTLPCGKRVVVMLPRTRSWAVAEVIDRGPYGAVMDDGSWGLKIKTSDEGKWRGCVDMTPALSRALGHDGWDPVVLKF